MPIACLMSLVESYVRHPSCGSNAEPKVTAAAQCATKGNGVALSQPRVAFGCRRDTCSDAKESPFPTFFKGKVRTTISLNTTRMNSCPLGMERGLAISCFFTAKGGLFYGQRPLFEPWRLLSSCKAWRWGVAATTRRKTCFPTAVTDSHKKAKPTTDAMAFCVSIITLQK